jgi:hypothetical protein
MKWSRLHNLALSIGAWPHGFGLSGVRAPALVVVGICVLLLATGRLVSRFFPSSGAKPLVVLGGLAVGLIISFRFSPGHQDYCVVTKEFARVAHECECGGKVGAGPESSAPRALPKIHPDRAAVELLDEYAGERAKAPDFKHFVAQQDPSAIAAKLGLQPEPEAVREIDKGLQRLKAPPTQDKPTDQKEPKSESDDTGPIWPLVPAVALFLYLWYLAAILFDLTVIWHHYIRQSAVLDRLRDIDQRRPEPIVGTKTPAAATPGPSAAKPPGALPAPSRR